MKIKKEDIPVTMEAPGTVMRALPGFGGMTVAFHELPRGTDFTPLLKGLENDSCHYRQNPLHSSAWYFFG